MSISRRLPQSDDGRYKALTNALNRKNSVAPADMAITAATIVRLDVIQPEFKSGMQERGNALVAQSSSTSQVDTARDEAKLYISHFIQVFNLGVKRNVYPASARAYYQLDVNSDAVPSLSTEADILIWGQRLQDGDVSRTGAGGAAMSNPTIAEVNAKVADFNTKNQAQGLKKTAFDNAQEAVAGMRPEADKVIKKVWDEVETFYNEEPAPSMRRRAREWGVVYVSTIPNYITVTVTQAVGGEAIEGATVTETDSGDTFITNALGIAIVKTNLAEDVTLLVSAPDFVTQEITQNFENGVHEYAVGVQMVAE